jgi:hypothetical protein
MTAIEGVIDPSGPVSLLVDSDLACLPPLLDEFPKVRDFM